MEQQLLLLQIFNDSPSLYSFLIDMLNIIILAVTLWYLIIYTRETQEMKREMVIQRKMSDAHDVYFDMKINYYPLKDSYDGQVFGELKTSTSLKHTIINFLFLDENSKKIGGHCLFHKIQQKDDLLVTNYSINHKQDMLSFIKTLNNNKGLIKAEVLSTSGNKFIYTYKAIHDHYKNAEKFPNTADGFILIKKEII